MDILQYKTIIFTYRSVKAILCKHCDKLLVSLLLKIIFICLHSHKNLLRISANQPIRLGIMHKKNIIMVEDIPYSFIKITCGVLGWKATSDTTSVCPGSLCKYVPDRMSNM